MQNVHGRNNKKWKSVQTNEPIPPKWYATGNFRFIACSFIICYNKKTKIQSALFANESGKVAGTNKHTTLQKRIFTITLDMLYHNKTTVIQNVACGHDLL